MPYAAEVSCEAGNYAQQFSEAELITIAQLASSGDNLAGEDFFEFVPLVVWKGPTENFLYAPTQIHGGYFDEGEFYLLSLSRRDDAVTYYQPPCHYGDLVQFSGPQIEYLGEPRWRFDSAQTGRPE